MRSRCLLAALAISACAGCPSDSRQFGDTPTVSGWSRDRFDNVTYTDAFQAAQHAASQWFGIAESRPESGRIVTVFGEATQRGGGERLRDVLRSPNTMRRRAILRVVEQPRDKSLVIECTVQRQRLDTADARSMQPRSDYESSGSQTPIQGEAGATRDQTEVWTDIGRDRDLERQILDVARDRLARRPAASAPHS